jgi:hypothetical protein
MAQFAIRCLPRAPVAGEELERWLERELEELRRDISQGTIRLSRLIDPLPTTDVGIGWLIEFDLPEHQFQLDGGRIATTLRDLRLLGFQPTLLAPPGAPGLRPADRILAKMSAQWASEALSVPGPRDARDPLEKNRCSSHAPRWALPDRQRSGDSSPPRPDPDGAGGSQPEAPRGVGLRPAGWVGASRSMVAGIGHLTDSGLVTATA